MILDRISRFARTIQSQNEKPPIFGVCIQQLYEYWKRYRCLEEPVIDPLRFVLWQRADTKNVYIGS